MPATPTFCTDHSIAQGQPLAGTGAMALRHLFIRWPKGRWRSPRYESVGLEPVLQRAIYQSYGVGRYVGLLESDGGPDLELVSFPDSRTALPSSQAEAAELIRAWAEGTPLEGPVLPRPVVLCCTDAKVNACCARYGFPIYKALRQHADSHGFDVMQTTHFGGCHFAPSVIVMPQRARYGRLSVEEIPHFLSTLAEGRHYLKSFKGRPELSEIEQCAEIAAWHWAEDNGYRQSDVQLTGQVTESEDQALCQVNVATSTLHIALQQRTFEMYGTCRSMDESEDKTALRWIVTNVTVGGP